MYTSSYNKITAQTVNNGINSFSKSIIQTFNYTGDTRTLLKKQIPNGDTFEQSVYLSTSNDYFVTFSSNNVAMTIRNDAAETICTLDSQNGYQVLFAKSGNPESSSTFYSSDGRYTMRSANFLDIENTDTKTGIISVERLYNTFV